MSQLDTPSVTIDVDEVSTDVSEWPAINVAEDARRREAQRFADPSKLPELAAAVGRTFLQRRVNKKVEMVQSDMRLLSSLVRSYDKNYTTSATLVKPNRRK